MSLRSEGTRLLLDGALTMETVPALLAQARLACSKGIETVDFAAVIEIDSAAIAFALELKRTARDTGRRIGFENLPQGMLNLAQMYSVSEQFQS
ncbi:MAG: STAS domain-containing protein [Pseudomonadales bacterium]|nr:STAS domain-containing protein [Pseudomonadales bacterium]